MQYRDFGKTGFKISALGFGAMRLPIPENQDKNAKDDLGPAVDLLRYGFEKGINYVDTAYMYCDGRSDRDGSQRRMAGKSQTLHKTAAR